MPRFPAGFFLGCLRRYLPAANWVATKCTKVHEKYRATDNTDSHGFFAFGKKRLATKATRLSRQMREKDTKEYRKAATKCTKVREKYRATDNTDSHG